MRRTTRPTAQRRTGTAVVELAVVLPILALLLVGIWELGRMVQVQQVLSNAAREGARRAATGTRTIADVDTAVKNYLAAAGFNTNGYTLKIINVTQNPSPAPGAPSDDPTAANQLDHLRITVTLPFNNVKWAFLNQITSSSTLSATIDWYCMKDQPLVVDPTMPSS
jgi:Flp pilus assembly protein TadG